MNYFQPDMGTIYLLKYISNSTTSLSDNGFISTMNGFSSSNNIRGWVKVYYDTYESCWQLMPIGTNSFIIVNQQDGGVLTVEDNNGNPYCTAKSLDENTPTIVGIQGNNGLYALFMPNYDAYIYPVHNSDGSYRLLVEAKGSADDAAVWDLQNTNITSNWESTFPDLANPNYIVPELPAVADAIKPVFDNEGNAPVVTALSLGKSTYLPFCLVTDNSMSASKAITDSPYYLLQQYQQYYQASCVENETGGTITLVDTWEYGSSESKSRNFTQKIGIDVGFNMTENEIFVKETESVNLSANLGFEEGNTSTSSDTMSKQVRVEVLPNNKLALYGVSTSYKLFRFADTTNVANQQNPTAVSQVDNYAKMANKFLTITYALDS
ncbi:MAG: hypothetical protein ACPG49_10545 [Chitinophagales bacterium]